MILAEVEAVMAKAQAYKAKQDAHHIERIKQHIVVMQLLSSAMSELDTHGCEGHFVDGMIVRLKSRIRSVRI